MYRLVTKAEVEDDWIVEDGLPLTEEEVREEIHELMCYCVVTNLSCGDVPVFLTASGGKRLFISFEKISS